jgi:hypothetical protein
LTGLLESEAATSLRAAGALAALAGLFVSAPVARAQDSSPGTSVARDSAYAPGEYRVFTGAGVPATLDDVVAAMG